MLPHSIICTFLLPRDVRGSGEPALALGGDGIGHVAGQTCSVLVAGQHSELVADAGLEGLHYEGCLGLLDDGLPVFESLL